MNRSVGQTRQHFQPGFKVLRLLGHYPRWVRGQGVRVHGGHEDGMRTRLRVGHSVVGPCSQSGPQAGLQQIITRLITPKRVKIVRGVPLLLVTVEVDFDR